MFRITRQTDYGILLLAHFGTEPRGAILAAKDLAERTGVPLPTVAKILKRLARHDVLDSHRGAHGGYALARHPDELSLLELLDALEGPVAMTECTDDSGHSECSIESTCRTRVNWRTINEAVRSALAGITLAEMICPAGAVVAMARADAPERPLDCGEET